MMPIITSRERRRRSGGWLPPSASSIASQVGRRFVEVVDWLTFGSLLDYPAPSTFLLLTPDQRVTAARNSTRDRALATHLRPMVTPVLTYGPAQTTAGALGTAMGRPTYPDGRVDAAVFVRRAAVRIRSKPERTATPLTTPLTDERW